MIDLKSYAFMSWTEKPQELIDLEKLITDKNARQEKKVDFYDVLKMKDKVYASEEVVDYLKELNKVISINYGNYYWLLNLRNTVDINQKIEISIMLNEFREKYDPKLIKNLPASKEIIEDMKAYRIEQAKELEPIQKAFGGEIETLI